VDGRARPVGSGLEPESTDNEGRMVAGRTGGEDDIDDALMRTRRRWTGHPRNTVHAPCFSAPQFASTAICCWRRHQCIKLKNRQAGGRPLLRSVRFYQFIWLRLTTTTHNHRRDPDPLSPLLYLLSYLCCQRRLLGSHPCRWALVLVTRGFCQPATTHAGREHTRVKHRVSRSITLLADKFSYYHQ